MTGWKDWQIGEVVTESDFQSFVQDQVVQRYADASARTSALGTAVAEGMVSYLEDTNKVEVYDGTAWTDFSGDITGITAGTGLTGGGTAGDVTLNADYAAIGSAVSITASQVTDLTASAAAINTIDDGTQGYTALSNGTAGISYQPVSHNYIINGAFDVWQRGTSFSVTNNFAYTTDRWAINDFSGGTIAVSRQTFSPGSAPVSGYEGTFFTRWSRTSATNTNGSYLVQRIEDVRAFAGQTATFSFWAKTSSGTVTLSVPIDQNFGSGGSSAVNLASQNVTVTTSWTRHSLTYNIPSISGKTIGDSSFLAINFAVAGDANFELDIWGVQLEAGSVATPFKRNANSLQGELAACQRYYFKTGENAGGFNTLGNGISSSTTESVFTLLFPVPMRARATTITATNLCASDFVNYNLAISSISFVNRNTTSATIVATHASGATQYRPAYLRQNNSTTGNIAVDAEL